MPRRHRPTLRRRRATALALTTIGTLLTLGAPTGAAAAPADPGPSRISATPRAGAAATPLSPARRAALVKAAQTAAGATAQRLALGAQEKLLVKDVVQDADGATHTRYERTYAGLPVLGGDLVVHSVAGRTTVSRATAATLKVPSLTPKLSASSATGKALAAAKGADVAGASTGRAPRLVVWASKGKPVLAWETVVDGVQDDGTPSELQVVTDATTGKPILAAEKVHTGTGTGQYVGAVPVGSTRSGSTYQLTDPDRGGHKTYDLNQGTSGTGTLFTDADNVWGNGCRADRADRRRRRRVRRGATWDYYKNVYGRNGIAQRRRRRLQPRPLRQQLRQRVLVRQLLLHDLRRRHGQRRTRWPRSTWRATR